VISYHVLAGRLDIYQSLLIVLGLRATHVRTSWIRYLQLGPD
jgi:hypothetical protein